MATLPVKKMRAAILTALRSPLVIDEVELPQELGVGQVFVEMFYSGLCGSQIGEIQGVKGEDKYLPHLLGHEGTGKVVAIGPGVKHVTPGDVVVLHWRKSVGIESAPPSYTWQGKKLNAGLIATFNEFAIVSENRVTKLTEDLNLEAASLLGCAVLTGLGVANNNANIKIGESVVVMGAGGVGLNVIEGARLCGAYPIIAVDLYKDKLALATKFGATHTIDASKGGVDTVIKEIIKTGVDVWIDNTGLPKLIEMAYSLTTGTGKVILVGVPKAGDNISIYSLPLHLGKTLTGSHGGEANPSVDIPRYAKLASAGILNINALVSERCSLDKLNTSITNMMEGKVVGRCVLKLGN